MSRNPSCLTKVANSVLSRFDVSYLWLVKLAEIIHTDDIIEFQRGERVWIHCEKEGR